MAHKTTFLAGLIFLLSSLLFAQGELCGPVYIIGDDGRLYIDHIPDTVTASYLAVIDDGWLKKLDIDNLELDTSNITGLYDYLNAKSDTGHVHDTSDVTGLHDMLDGKSDVGHDHDTADVNNLSLYLSQKLDVTDTSDLARKIHDHTISDVTGLQDALELKLDITELNNYYTKTNLSTSGQSSVHWGNVTNKPTVFPPASHNHSASNITSGTLSNSRLSFNPDYFVQGETIRRSCNYGASNPLDNNNVSAFYTLSPDDPSNPPISAYGIHINSANANGYGLDIIGKGNQNKILWSGIDGGTRQPWREIWHGGNLDTSDYYTKTNLQTSGQASVHWGNVTNKPTEFPPEDH